MTYFRSSLTALGLLTLLTIPGLAQKARVASYTADKYVISAAAGGVNAVEGVVTVSETGGRTGQLLKGDGIRVGETVRTSEAGRAEVMLNPGSFMRVGPSAEFSFRSTTLDDLEIDVRRGSAMFEVFASNDFKVTVSTPAGKTFLIESGVYRVDVAPSGASTVSVIEGKADAGLTKPVKEGRMAQIGVTNSQPVKFDRGERDELAEWSRTRAKDLAKMTAGLKNDAVRDSLVSSFNRGRWGIYDSFGLWVFNPTAGAYCFLPFGSDWYSPYGHSYRTGLWWYNLPPIIRIPQNPSTPVRITGREKIRQARNGSPIPPYTSVERKRQPRAPIAIDSFPDASSPMPRRIIRPSAPASVPVRITGKEKQ